ncbi:hypothetical protein JCM14036_14700 [Desulfotomaculum defluvii]
MDITNIGALMILDKVMENHRTEEDASVKQIMASAVNTDFYFNQFLNDIEDRFKYNPPHLGNNLDVYV